MNRPEPDDAPIVITDAPRSYEDEFAARRRRYSIMMALRVPCLVLAALFYQTPWLAATLIILSIPLPWMAVIIANDRLPKKRSTFRRHTPTEGRELEAGQAGNGIGGRAGAGTDDGGAGRVIDSGS